MFRRKSNPTMPTSSATKMAAAPLNATIDDAGIPPTARLDLSGGSCGCGRFTSELRHPAFEATEVNGPTLHGPATFAPSGRWILLAKTVITLWSASALISGLLETDPMVFYLAYLTHWSLIMTLLYMTLSWMLTLGATVRKPNNSNEATDVTLLHKVVWGLFSIAAPAEIVVVVGYWGLEWDGSSSGFYYRNFMVHGVIMGLLLVDGLVLNKIPLRLRHFGFILLYLFLYLVWTLIHALLNIGNPTTDGDDDTLYTALQWRDDPVSTAQVAGQFLVVLAPIAFCIIYALSLYSFPCGCNGQGRRYVGDTMNGDNATKNNANTTTSYVEMSDLQSV